MKEKILRLIEEILQVPEGRVTENTLMEELEEWDSVAQVMIIGELESRLGVRVDLEAAMEMSTPDTIHDTLLCLLTGV